MMRQRLSCDQFEASALFGGLLFAVILFLPDCATGQESLPRGHTDQFKITAPTRLDWVFALANQSPAEEPDGLLTEYDSTKQRFELYVPDGVSSRESVSLILFISPGQSATGLTQFRDLCDREGVVFASPHQAGNRTPGPRRIRIVMDTLDEIRRRIKVDPDRTYILTVSSFQVASKNWRTCCLVLSCLIFFVKALI